MATLLLLGSCLVVGIFIGAVGIGGVLLVPALMVFSQLSVHQAAATALFSFFFTGLLGAWLFARRGTIAWKVAGPVCAGAFALSYAGADRGRPHSGHDSNVDHRGNPAVCRPVYHVAENSSSGGKDKRYGAGTLLGIGAASGFGAGISGAGGPLFSVPLMLALQFDPLVAVGSGQVVQIASSFSGSLSNLSSGAIQYALALPVTLAELIGVLAGVRIAHAAPGNYLRSAAAALCIVSAAGMVAKTVS
jgi:uncharacterized membrane protein YfcA